MRQIVALSVLGLVASCNSGTFALVNLDALSGAPDTVQSIELQLTLGTRTASTTLREKSGNITLPTTKSLEIRSGTGELGIVAIARDAGGNELGRGSGMGTIQAGATTHIDVTIDFGGTGDMQSDDGALDGSTPQPMLAVDHQPSYDFGTVVVGSTGGVTLTVRNAGFGISGPISAASVTGANASLFTVGNDGCMGQTLAAGGSCTVALVLTPVAAGSVSASFSLGATPGGSISLPLTATSVLPGDITLTPAPLDFSTVLVGGSADRTLNVSNGGGVLTGGISFTINGSDGDQFTVGNSGTCTTGQTLAPGATCTLAVHFAPTTGGSKSATLTVNANPGGPGVVNLTALAQTPAVLVFDLPTYAASTVAVGSSKTMTVTLSNSGGQTSGMLGTLATTGDPSFSVIGGGTCTPTATLPGGMSCTIMVQFQPTAFGSVSGSISVTASPGGTTTPSALTGTGSQVFTLTVSKAGGGNGTLTIDGVDCASFPCTKMYTAAASAPTAGVTQTAAVDSNFNSWSGDCSSNGACGPVMSANRNVTGTFDIKSFVTTVNVVGIEGATLTVSGQGLSGCAGPTCTTSSYNYAAAGNFQITSTATSGIVQAITGADCVENPSPAPVCTLNKTSAHTITARARQQHNFMFVTSTTATIPFGATDAASQANTNGICQARAKAAGLGPNYGNFVSWITTTNTSAKSKITTTGGWVRPDGLPFAPDLFELTNSEGVLFYVPIINEFGNSAGNVVVVTATDVTGMSQSGLLPPLSNCNNFTDPSSVNDITFGLSSGGTVDYTAFGGSVSSSLNPYHFYCFENSFNATVSPPPFTSATYRHAWLSNALYTPKAGGSVADADTVCKNDASSVGFLGSNYAALVAVPGGAASRFGGTKPWARLDGTVVAATPGDLMAGNWIAALDQGPFGGSYHGLVAVWTGAASPTDTTAGNNCTNWSSTSGSGIEGDSGSTIHFFQNTAGFSCANPAHVYCLEQ